MFYIFETGNLFVEIFAKTFFYKFRNNPMFELISCVTTFILCCRVTLRLYLPGELNNCMPYKIPFIILRTKQKMGDTFFGNRASAPKVIFPEIGCRYFFQLTDSRPTHRLTTSNSPNSRLEHFGEMFWWDVYIKINETKQTI